MMSNQNLSTVRTAVGLTGLLVIVFVGRPATNAGDHRADHRVDGGTDYDLSRYTIDGGGVVFSQTSNGQYELSGTIGQPDAGGPLAGSGYELTGGFWFRTASGDCNTDGAVNLFDYAAFLDCHTGPSGGPPLDACACFDLDHDDHVDLIDFGLFQVQFNRP